MTPFGGVSLFFHLLIVLLFGFIDSAKKYPVRILSILVIFLVAGLIFRNSKEVLVRAVKEENNFQLAQDAAWKCLPAVQKESSKRVILRIDDIQANAYGQISINMIEDAAKRDMKLVLGIIPNGFEKDQKIVRAVKKNICNLELAVHGWDHKEHPLEGGYEFEKISEEDAREKIKKSEKVLQKISGELPLAFIPPGNRISPGAKKVLKEEGIRYLSGDDLSSEFGMNATTYDFEREKLVENREILENCEKALQDKSYCVIVLHPQDYLTDDRIDGEKYERYIELLSELRKRDFMSITFGELEKRRSPSLPISL